MGSQNRIVHYLLLAIVSCDLVLSTYAAAIESGHVHLSPSLTVEGESLERPGAAAAAAAAPMQSVSHRIVKRKSRISIGRGFGKSKPRSQSKPKSPYPKQPAHNPHYNPGHQTGNMGPPPAYPGAGHGGMNHGGMGPPPAYPGSRMNYPHNPSYPSYPSGGGYPGGFNNHGFGGMGKGHGFGGGGGLGRTIGSAGFGAIAGTALGAYGGYKLGRMIGGLGRHGYYGYYSDQGRYVRCDPPKNIKVDPETNVSYIPLEEDYDKRCSYFDRPPPPYYNGLTSGHTTTMTLSYSVLLVALLASLFNMDARNRIAIFAIAGLAILL